MNTSRPALRRFGHGSFSAYASVPADRDTQRLIGELAALPAGDCSPGAPGASGWHRLVAAFHRSPAA